MGRAVQGSGHSGCASHCQYCRGDQSPYRVNAAPPASAAKAAGFGASNRATARVGATNTVLSIAPPHAFAFRLVLRRDTARPVAPLAHARHGIAGYFVPVFFLNMVDLGPGLLFARPRGRICALRRQPRRPRWISSRSMGRNLCRWAAQRTREAIPGLVPAPQAIAKRPDRGEGYTGTLAHIVAMSQVLHEELKSHGLPVQALCPGVVATEFHERQGLDLSAVPRMSADDVATAGARDGRGRLRSGRRQSGFARRSVQSRPRGLRRAIATTRSALRVKRA